jgi:hypothetical protein
VGRFDLTAQHGLASPDAGECTGQHRVGFHARVTCRATPSCVVSS